jgi:hypothetical protein
VHQNFLNLPPLALWCSLPSLSAKPCVDLF